MAKEKLHKTNAMRLLDAAHLPYTARAYDCAGGDNLGEQVARILGLDPGTVFKTLVLRGDRTGPVVACIPAAAALDLKALARASGNKAVDMLHVRDLFALTGYIRGGCSPIGMKKKFPTFFDESLLLLDRVCVSAGQPGLQLELCPGDLLAATGGQAVPLTVR